MLRPLAVPAGGLFPALLHAGPPLIAEAQTAHGAPVSVPCPLLVALDGLLRVGLGPDAPHQTVGQQQKPPGGPLPAGLSVELHRSLRVRFHPLALLHKPAQAALPLRVPRLGGRPVPAHRQLRVRVHSYPKLIVLA